VPVRSVVALEQAPAPYVAACGKFFMAADSLITAPTPMITPPPGWREPVCITAV